MALLGCRIATTLCLRRVGYGSHGLYNRISFVIPAAVGARHGNSISCLLTFSDLQKKRHFSSNNDNSNNSGRSAFRSISVHPSLLQYIQKVGVGIPKRNPKRRRLKKKKPIPNYSKEEDGEYHGHKPVLSRAEERELLGGHGTLQRQQKRARPSLGTPSKPQPPPPFGSGTNNETYQALPVKILGSVGLANLGDVQPLDELDFPRPSVNIPEVALVGRSNVGKSTLLNALLYGGQQSKQNSEDEEDVPKRKHNKKVTSQTARLPKGVKAVTSSKPGETRAITFYQVSAKKLQDDDNLETSSSKVSLILVDLPGYGFAYGPSSLQSGTPTNNAHPWQTLIEKYLLEQQRSSLKRILMLVDARHGMKRADFDFLESLQVRLKQQQKDARKKQQQQSPRQRELPPIQVVLTKCDLVSQADLARRIVQTRQQLSASLQRQSGALPEMLVSAQMEGHAGVLELQRELAALCG